MTLLRSKGLLLLVCGSAVLWSTSYFGSSALQAFEGRKRPSLSYAEHQVKIGAVSPHPSTDTENARGTNSSTPEDKESLKARAGELLARQQQAQSSDERRGLLLDLLDTYRQMLSLDETDTEALIMLADISFEQRLFDKAVSYFERYLQQKPEDNAARARYASALSFVGNVDAAIKELQALLDKDPENFQGLAFLAIAYAQKGEKVTARMIGEQALKVAPHEEAKNRLSSFLQKLDEGAQSSSEKPAVPPSDSTLNLPAEFDTALRKNPVAGPKFVQGSIKGKELVLKFKDFPMQAMPPFALQKFLTTLRTLPGAPNSRTVLFVDAATGEVMATHPFRE